MLKLVDRLLKKYMILSNENKNAHLISCVTAIQNSNNGIGKVEILSYVRIVIVL